MEINNKNTLVNFSNSLLKHFNVKTFHESIPEIDNILTGHKKIVVCLFDGLGQNVLRHHLTNKSHLRKHYIHTVNSVFPPTTAAATTAVLNAKFPIETGWLSWCQYFKDVDKNIVMFLGSDENSGEKLFDRSFALSHFPLKTILDIIHEQKPYVYTQNLSEFPINIDGPKKLRTARKMLKKTLSSHNSSLTYFYWMEPDHTMHEEGIYSKRTHRNIKRIDKFINQVANDNKDTLFLTIADHSLINVKYVDICEHEDLYSLLTKKIALEKRCPSFFVSEDNRKLFEELFNKYYGSHFLLLSKKEVLEKCLFGEGNPAPGSLDCFGDYVAISIDEYSLYASKDYSYPISFLKGHHAGGTIDERLIDISAFNI